jgi:isobutyryl-CoA mutase
MLAREDDRTTPRTAEAIEPLAARATRGATRSKKLLDMWPQMQQAYAGDEYVVKIRGRECAPS